MLDHHTIDKSTQELPSCRVEQRGDTLWIAMRGAWVLAHVEATYRTVEQAKAASGHAQAFAIDLGGIEALDTAGALALCRLKGELAQHGRADLVNARASHTVLLAEIERAGRTPPPPAPRESSVAAFAGALVRVATLIQRDTIRFTAFLGQASAALGRLIAHPRRFRGASFVHQIQQAGLNAVPIIALVCFLLGGVILQQAALQLQYFGAETLSIDMLGILALREIGVILAAVMVAGRSTSAYTAQIGTMKMREEIDAMRTIGIDPIETLVVPRILALMVALPLLVFIADVTALAGGAVMAKYYLGLDVSMYLDRLNSAVAIKHFYVGLIKAPFAALIVGLVGCKEGMSVEGSAESVGRHVTAAVVKAIFLVLIMDGLFAMLLSASGF